MDIYSAITLGADWLVYVNLPTTAPVPTHLIDSKTTNKVLPVSRMKSYASFCHHALFPHSFCRSASIQLAASLTML